MALRTRNRPLRITSIQDLENAPRLENGAFNLQGANLIAANLQGANLQGANLQGANLQGANLLGANLQGANLVQTNFEGANLQGANLRGANSQRANLRFAILQDANLRNVDLSEANLRGANLAQAQLVSMSLRRADLSGANLTGANLAGGDTRGANFQDANLENVQNMMTNGALNIPTAPIIVIRTIQDLENAPRLQNGAFNLRRADLQGANLQGANLQGANFEDSNLGDVNLQGANLQGSNLRSANLQDANFTGADLRGANIYDIAADNVIFNGANMEQISIEFVTLAASNLESANLRNATINNVDLTGSYLTQADLTGATITDVALTDANLTSAVLTDATISNVVESTNANFTSANLRNARITNWNLRNTNLDQADFTGAVVRNTRFVGARNIERAIGLNVQQRAARAPDLAAEPEPQGVAYEIHNAFNRIDINKLYNFFRSNIENINERLREFNGMNSTQFNNYLSEIMNNLLNTLSPQELSSLPTMPDGYYPGDIRNWRDVWNAIFNTRIRTNEFNQEIQTVICLSILFAINQGPNFQKNYILSYLNDVAFAYPIENTDTNVTFSRYFSCTKGIIERFVMSLNVAAETALTDPEVSEEIKTQYRRLKNILSGGVIDSRIVMELVTSWQNDNKNIITEKIGENNEFRSNKDGLVEQQKQALIQYLCCQLGLTVQELMSPENSAIQDTINYIFSDDNILDNTLGGRRKRTRKYKKKIIKHRKTKRIVKTKIKRIRKMKKKTMKKKK